MGRGSPICKRVLKKIVEYFKNNIPQHKIAKALQISSSTVHNIIKNIQINWRYLCAYGTRPTIFVGCPWSSGPQTTLHRITHRPDSVIDITKWAQEYLQKPLSVNRIRHAICRCQLKLYHAKRKPYVNMVQKRPRVPTVSKWKSVLLSDKSKFAILVGNHGRLVLRAKEEGDLPVCYQLSVQKPASLMVWGCIFAYSMGWVRPVLGGTMN